MEVAIVALLVSGIPAILIELGHARDAREFRKQKERVQSLTNDNTYHYSHDVPVGEYDEKPIRTINKY